MARRGDDDVEDDDDSAPYGPMTIDQYREYFKEKEAMANRDQLAFVNEVMPTARMVYQENMTGQRVDNTKQRLYFLTGDGGTGKSFTYNVFMLLIKFYFGI